MLDYLKKKLEGNVDDFVLIGSVVDSNDIKFVNNKIVKTGLESISSIFIFVAKDKKIVATTLKDLTEKGANNLVKDIIEFLKHAQPNNDYNGIANGPFSYNKIVDGFDSNVKDVDAVDIVESGINAALKNSKRVSGKFDANIGERRILTSGNVDATENFSSLYFSVRALNSPNESGHKTVSSRNLRDFCVEKISEKAGEIAKMSIKPDRGNEGRFDMIIDPLPLADLMGTVGSASSIDSVESGMSFFSGKIGEKIGDFNLMDDGKISGGLGSSSFDDEGVPTQRTKIISNGIFKTYLHNTSTAKKYGIKTTANAGLVGPSSSNLVLEGKKGNPFEIDKGIYVTNVWYTRFQNYATGDFSTIPRDGMFLVENGEIVKPINGLRISENMLNLLKNLSTFGKNVEQITSWEAETPVFTPTVLINKVKFTRPVG
jgi:PmbA protein